MNAEKKIEVFSRRNASNVLPVMFGGTDTAGYLAMNPNGRIPTIRDGDFVLWESNAIIRYLCRRHDSNNLLLPESEEDYALADQWMDWHKTTLYPPYIDLVWALVRTEPVVRDRGKIADLLAGTEDALAVLERRLAGSSHVAGNRLTMADIPFGALVHRYLNLELERTPLPRIDAWYRRLAERPAFAEHVMFPFGRNPGEWYRLERETP